MGQPAARIGDMHVCPMITVLVPHVGGPVVGPGCPTVLIGGMPAAVLGDICTCTGPPDVIMLGSSGVQIGGKPAARMGDMCAHGGTIVVGCPTVLIGESGGDSAGAGGGGGIGNAGQMVNTLNNQSLLDAAAAGDGLAPKSSDKDLKAQFTLIDDAGKAVADIDYEITTSDGAKHTGKTDGSGKTETITGFTSSQCKVVFKSKSKSKSK